MDAKAIIDSTSANGGRLAPTPIHRVARAAADARTPAELAAALTAGLEVALAPDQVRLFEVAEGGILPPGVDHVVATGATHHLPASAGADSGLFVPVGAARVAILLTERPREFSPAEITEAETLAHVAAAGFGRLAAEQGAQTDALTGLLNHGAMQVRLREEIARARRDDTPLSCVIIDLDDFKRVNDVRGHQAGDDLLRRVARLLEQQVRPYDQVARYGGDEFVLLLPGSDEATAHAVAERVRDEMTAACSLGVAEWREPLDADALLEHADTALLLAKRTGKGRVAVANPDVERELATLKAQRGSPSATHALAAAVEERDNLPREHSRDVVHLARGVAMLLGLHIEQVERIAHAALLHDVGKLSVPTEILHKPGPLTPDEWEVMADHPVAGERMLLRIPDLAAIAPLVRHEHEHWDGSGYPDGLRGRMIPVGSRIILACDAYHAMIADRPYRAALSPADAAAELRRGSGAQFDPDVVEAVLDLLGHDRPQVPDRVRGVPMPAPPLRTDSRP